VIVAALVAEVLVEAPVASEVDPSEQAPNTVRDKTRKPTSRSPGALAPR